MQIEARGAGGERARVRVSVTGDPGYLCTAVMAAESALCLAMDAESALLPSLPRLPSASASAVQQPPGGKPPPQLHGGGSRWSAHTQHGDG
jgi:hypothetical protein